MGLGEKEGMLCLICSKAVPEYVIAACVPAKIIKARTSITDSGLEL
jgi:hypothetical protein